MKLADVLWDAANLYLWDGSDLNEEDRTTDSFSCNAVAYAVGLKRGHYNHEAFAFLNSLGASQSALAFNRATPEFWRYTRKECQGVRYMWLLLAMHVAEDEGIEI